MTPASAAPRKIDAPQFAPLRVVTVANTSAARYLTSKGIGHSTVEKVVSAYAALESGQADARVFDAPVLLHYSIRAGNGKVRMAGEIFNPEAYGIALREAARCARQPAARGHQPRAAGRARRWHVTELV